MNKRMDAFRNCLTLILLVIVLAGAASKLQVSKTISTAEGQQELVRETTGRLLIVDIDSGTAKYVKKTRQVPPELDSVVVGVIGWAADHELK